MTFFTRLLEDRIQSVQKWDEEQHPRGPDGHFIDSGESPTAAGEKEYADAVAGKRDAWVPGGGGKEVPSVDKMGNRYLKVFNPATGKHGNYNMNTDIVEDDRTNEDTGRPASWGANQTRSLHEVARDIRRDWKNKNYAAVPYLDAMGDLDGINDNYMADSGKSVVSYFLSNASSYKGDKAKELKAELKDMLKDKPIKPKAPRAPKADGNGGTITPKTVMNLRRSFQGTSDRPFGGGFFDD
jgi:hypothetical protein